MPIGWYIVPYKRIVPYDGPWLAERYCEIEDHRASLTSVAYVQILGDRAIVKLRATTPVLQTLNGLFKRLPKDTLLSPLSDLSPAVKTALRDEALDQGYTMAEITARFGTDLGAYTLGDVLRFMATRRRLPRYDSGTDVVIMDGAIVIISEQAIDEIEAAVQ